eukprot:symbB.v1.2.015436.t1/scaffold1121.1/size137196/4
MVPPGWSMATTLATVHRGLRKDAITMGSMLRLYGGAKLWPRALHLLQRNLIDAPLRCYNACISVLEQSSLWMQVLLLMRHLSFSSCNVISANSLISASGWSLAFASLNQMSTVRLLPDEISYNSAMTSIQGGGSWPMACMSLKKMSMVMVTPSVVSFNSALSHAFSFQNSWSLFLASLQLLNGAGLVPSIITFNTGLALCEKQPKPFGWIFSMWILSSMLRQRCRRDPISFASLLSSCNWLMALRVLQLSATEDVPPTSAGLGVPWQFTAVWKGILVLSRLAACAAAEMARPGFMRHLMIHFIDLSTHFHCFSHSEQQTSTGRELLAFMAKQETRTAWVGDVESWMDEEFLHRAFSPAGFVTNIKIVRRANNANGFAFIEFNDPASVSTLVGKSGDAPRYQALGFNFRVNSAAFSVGDVSRKQSQDHSIYVGNLDFLVKEHELLKAFSDRYSSVAGAKLLVDPNTQMSRGFGFVRFRDWDEAEQAIREMQGVYLGSKMMKVRPSHQRTEESKSHAPWMVNTPPAAVPVVATATVICITGLDAASAEDLQQLLQRCAAFGAIVRHIFVEASCFVEFQEATAAEAAASHLSGVCGLSVNFSEVSVIEYYRTLQLEGWLPFVEASPVVGGLVQLVTDLVEGMRFPPRPVLNCLLGSLRCCADGKPDYFGKLLHFCIFPLQGCLQGCLTQRSSRPLLRQPVKIGIAKIDAEWIILDRKPSDTSKVIIYFPGGGFVARDHTASVFASRVLPRLSQKMAVVPPILVLNYTLPSNPQQVKQEVEVTLSWLRGQGFHEMLVAGDSAGGYLAVQTFLEQTHPKICGAVGICPPLDLTFSADSYERNTKSCFLTKKFVEYARNTMHSLSLSGEGKDKRIALLKEHPMLLVSCEEDLMCDDVSHFAQQAVAAGVAEGVQVCDVPLGCWALMILMWFWRWVVI